MFVEIANASTTNLQINEKKTITDASKANTK